MFSSLCLHIDGQNLVMADAFTHFITTNVSDISLVYVFLCIYVCIVLVYNGKINALNMTINHEIVDCKT